MLIKKANIDDAESVCELYKNSASVYPENLTQYVDELDVNYIKNEIKNAIERGIILLAVDNGRVVGCFKAYTSKYRKLSHIMANATFVVSPNSTGEKAFVLLFRSFMTELRENYKHIYKLIPL